MENKNPQEGFYMDLGMAMEFYSLCDELGLDTLEERRDLLRQFVKDKQAKYIRDVEAFVGDKKAIKFPYKRKQRGK